MVKDVVDISWSPCDKFLASCGIDNLVIIWDVAKACRLATLKKHKTWVVGCEWSPNNKTLATQSSDGTVIIWETGTWHILKKFSSFLEEKTLIDTKRDPNDGNQISFSRMSFSPDGKFLGCSRGIDTVFTAAVFNLVKNKHSFSYIGHKSSTTVIKFSPRKLICRKSSKSVSLCVVGSKDNSLSVWRSDQTRPIAVLNKFFTKTVIDVSWEKKGTFFIACSFDGSIAYFDFKNYIEKEFSISKNHNDWDSNNFNLITEDNEKPKVTKKTKQNLVDLTISKKRKKATKLKISKKHTKPSEDTMENYRDLLDYFNGEVFMNKTIEYNRDREITKFSTSWSFGYFGSDNKFSLALNSCKQDKRMLTKVVCKVNKNRWRTELPGSVVCAAASRNHFAICTKQKIYIYTLQGFLFCPVIHSEDKIVAIFANSTFLAVLSYERLIKVFKVGEVGGNVSIFYSCRIAKNITLLKIKSLSVSLKGNITINMKNKNSIVYLKSLESWVNSWEDIPADRNDVEIRYENQIALWKNLGDKLEHSKSVLNYVKYLDKKGKDPALKKSKNLISQIKSYSNLDEELVKQVEEINPELKSFLFEVDL